MKSKLKFISYLLMALCVIQAASFPALFSDAISGFKKAPFTCLLVRSFFLFLWMAFLFGIIKTAIISLRIENGEIFVKRYCGLGGTRVYSVEEINRFKISISKVKGKSYESLYLTIEDLEIATLSEYYHSNYEDMKKLVVANGIKYIGSREYDTMIRYLKRIFSK